MSHKIETTLGQFIAVLMTLIAAWFLLGVVCDISMIMGLPSLISHEPMDRAIAYGVIMLVLGLICAWEARMLFKAFR